MRPRISGGRVVREVEEVVFGERRPLLRVVEGMVGSFAAPSGVDEKSHESEFWACE